MAGKRFYDDGCFAARALDLTAERWALLVVRELLLGPRRFTDLKRELAGISPNILSQRLDELEQAGIVVREELPPPTPVHLYALTDRGQALSPVLESLARWGAGAPPSDRPMGAAALVLALKAQFDPERARWLSTTVGLIMPEQRVLLGVSRRRLELLGETGGPPDATLSGTASALAEVLLLGNDLAAAREAGTVDVHGDRRSAEAFATLFPGPAEDGGA